MELLRILIRWGQFSHLFRERKAGSKIELMLHGKLVHDNFLHELSLYRAVRISKPAAMLSG